jgi:hypothetical protein
MGYPTTYTWLLANPPTGSGVPPVTGSTPTYPLFQGAYSSNVSQQFARGLRFANVPGGDAKNVVHGSSRVWHVNSLQNVQSPTMDQFDLTGVIKYRFRGSHGYFHGTNNYYVFQRVPIAVRHFAPNSTDRFGNPRLPFTGTGSI